MDELPEPFLPHSLAISRLRTESILQQRHQQISVTDQTAPTGKNGLVLLDQKNPEKFSAWGEEFDPVATFTGTSFCAVRIGCRLSQVGTKTVNDGLTPVTFMLLYERLV